MTSSLSWIGLRFDDAEYEARLTALRRELTIRELHAAVLSDERLGWYFTGFGAATPIGSTARPRVLVVPVEGDPAVFVHRSTLRCVREMSAVEDVRGYCGLRVVPIGEIADLLRDRGAMRVGAELGGELRPTVSFSDLRLLDEAVGPLADAAAAVWAVRMRKSTAEIVRIRRACEITSRAYEEGLPKLRVGMSERDAASLLQRELVETGADSSWIWLASGSGEFDRVDGVPRDRKFERGDLVFVDMGACTGGYWADFSRACVFGRATEHQRKMQQLVIETTAAGVEATVPGATTEAVAKAIDGALEKRGLTFSSRADRYGHGLGLGVTEPPDIWPGDRTVIEPGMVLTIEPGTCTREGMFHCEQNLIVEKDGPVVLSTARQELWEV